MRKNIMTVLRAFEQGIAHREATCHTDGISVYSYSMRIASRESGTVRILAKARGPSVTTRGQITAAELWFRNRAETVDVL